MGFASFFTDFSTEMILGILPLFIVNNVGASKEYGYLPIQVPIGEGPYSEQLLKSIPHYEELISMISIGRTRPSIPEYPEIANHIKQAIDEVYYGLKDLNMHWMMLFKSLQRL
jgi:hypothetical protein